MGESTGSSPFKLGKYRGIFAIVGRKLKLHPAIVRYRFNSPLSPLHKEVFDAVQAEILLREKQRTEATQSHEEYLKSLQSK